MNDNAIKFQAAGQKSEYRPYDNLYIYYLQGPVNLRGDKFGPDFIGNWEEDGFSFLFFSSPAEPEIDFYLERHPENTLLDSYDMPYEQWQGGRVTGMKLGPFFIRPPWDTTGENSGHNEDGGAADMQIVLDPGVVFGSGLHTTTKDCLDALGFLFSRNRIDTALDLGTGTGLLALASVKLGCKHCMAVDFNLLACRTALNNVRLNGMADKILVAQGRAEDFIGFPSDVIIANIHYDVMKSLIRSDGLFQGRWFILSGLMRSQAREIADLLSRRSVNIIKTWEQDGIWHTFLGEVV